MEINEPAPPPKRKPETWQQWVDRYAAAVDDLAEVVAHKRTIQDAIRLSELGHHHVAIETQFPFQVAASGVLEPAWQIIDARERAIRERLDAIKSEEPPQPRINAVFNFAKKYAVWLRVVAILSLTAAAFIGVVRDWATLCYAAFIITVLFGRQLFGK